MKSATEKEFKKACENVTSICHGIKGIAIGIIIAIVVLVTAFIALEMPSNEQVEVALLATELNCPKFVLVNCIQDRLEDTRIICEIDMTDECLKSKYPTLDKYEYWEKESPDELFSVETRMEIKEHYLNNLLPVDGIKVTLNIFDYNEETLNYYEVNFDENLKAMEGVKSK